jgi:hypothetical protein
MRGFSTNDLSNSRRGADRNGAFVHDHLVAIHGAGRVTGHVQHMLKIG